MFPYHFSFQQIVWYTMKLDERWGRHIIFMLKYSLVFLSESFRNTQHISAFLQNRWWLTCPGLFLMLSSYCSLKYLPFLLTVQKRQTNYRWAMLVLIHSGVSKIPQLPQPDLRKDLMCPSLTFYKWYLKAHTFPTIAYICQTRSLFSNWCVHRQCSPLCTLSRDINSGQMFHTHT